MKLLITLDFPPQRGGIQRYLFDCVSAHYAASDRVVHATATTSTRLRRAGVTPVVAISCATSAKLIRIIALTGYLILHRRHISTLECGNVYAAIAAWVATPFINCPYHVYTYGTELIGLTQFSLKHALLKAVLGKAQGLFVLGHYTHSLLSPLKLIPPVTHLPARLRQDYLCKAVEATSRYQRPHEPFTILSVGRLVPHKGHQILLEALAMIPDTVNWRLQLVGEGPLCHSLQAYCAAHHWGARVSIENTLDDQQLHQRYAQAHVLVLASLEQASGTEGFGIVLLEAMAHGLPIIASRCGGIPQVVDNGRVATLVEPGNASQLAAALTRAASAPDHNRTTAATEHLRRHYVW